MCKSCSIAIDQDQSDQFSQRMIDILNHSALGLISSIGYRTDLFDAMAE